MCIEEFNKILNDINTISLLEDIKEFRKLDLRYYNIETIKEKIDQMIPVTIFKREDITNNRFYRIRKDVNCIGNEHFFINREDDLWYNPIKEDVEIGRLNNKGEQILYCSSTLDVACHELNIKEDEVLVIEYNVKKGEKLNAYDLGFDYTMYKEIYEKLDDKAKVNYLIIQDFINVEFQRDVQDKDKLSYLYKTSNALADLYIKNHEDWDVCIYPSIASKYGYNYAFNSKTVKQKLDISKFYVAKISFYKKIPSLYQIEEIREN